MFKFIAFVIFAIIANVSCKATPGLIGAPLAYSAPLVASVPAAAIVSREYHGNGFSSPYIAAPYAAPYVAPYAASYAAPYTAPYAAYSAQLVGAPAAYAAGPVLL